jgi:hypothetical protein
MLRRSRVLTVILLPCTLVGAGALIASTDACSPSDEKGSCFGLTLGCGYEPSPPDPPTPPPLFSDDGAWQPIPPSLEGWEPYIDYSSECGFYIPAPGTIVPPIAWEPCSPATPTFSGEGCRQIRLDWERPRALGNEWIAGAKALRQSDGKVVLITSRGIDGDLVRIIADADGPVRNATRQHSTKCALGLPDGFGEYYTYHVYDSEAKGVPSSFGGGAIGGRIGERPRTVLHFHDTLPHDFVAIEPGLIHWRAALDLHSWQDGTKLKTIPVSPSDEPLYYNQFAFSAGFLFWNMGSLAMSRIKVWSAAGGTHDFLTAGEDPKRGYGDLGTDGVDMVWSEGTRTDVDKPYPRLSVMTSAFATNGASLSPRFLRSDITGYGFGVTPFVVGCGYAARSTIFEPSPGTFTNGMFVVRLADGVAWRLPDNVGMFQWRTPLGITCDEIFALVQVKPEAGTAFFNIARLRLDALGVGTPP